MKALFFGLGGVGQRHLRNLLQLYPNCEVAAVRHAGKVFEIENDMSASHGVDIVEKYNIQILQDMAEGIAFTPDIAIVANPSAKHVETCLPLLNAGIPVFLEKPAATTSDDFERLENTAKASGAKIAVGYQLRWHPGVKRLKEVLDSGDLGRVHSVEVAVHAHMPSWHAYEKPNEFYAGVRALGGGVVLTEIHEIDLLTWFFGRPESVYAIGGRLGDADIDVEDTFAATLRCGTKDHFIPVSLVMSFVQEPPSRRFKVNGSKGVAVLEIPKLRLTVLNTDSSEREVFDATGFDRNQMFVEELTNFIDSLKTEENALTSLDNIRDGQLTALAVRRSLETDQPKTP